MKTIKVAAAIICDSFPNIKKVYATARGYGEFRGMWEFPGGKVEAGETSRQALKREIPFTFPWTASGVKSYRGS